jgi:hypothetical protein
MQLGGITSYEDSIADYQSRVINRRDHTNQLIENLPRNGNLGFVDLYFVLDSKSRDSVSRLIDGGYVFRFSNISGIAQQSEIRLADEPANIVELEVTGEFAYPMDYVAEDAVDVGYYLHNEINMQIRELMTHGYNDAVANFQFRFTKGRLLGRNRLQLMPVSSSSTNSAKIVLRNTVSISSLSFVFRTPVRLARPSDDILTVQITYTDPVIFTVMIAPNRSGESGHEFTNASADCISFMNFVVSSTPGYNSAAYDSVVYRETMYQVTVIDPTTFSIPLDFSGAIASDPARPTFTNIFVETRRIRIPMRMRVLRTYSTNHLNAVM